ncbi:MMPL family transporter [Spirillospora sp. NBC_00431]
MVLLWLAALAVLSGAAMAKGSNTDDSLSLPGTESRKALELLQESMPDQSGEEASIVWQTPGGDVRAAGTRQRMTTALDGIARLPKVGAVTSPYASQGAPQISEDGRTAYATVTFTDRDAGLPKSDVLRVVTAAHDARAPGLRVEVGGGVISEVEEPGSGNSELIGIAAASVVLFLAFGSLFATLLPIVTAVAGVGCGLMGITLATHVVIIGEVGPILGALIGLGVGIDYALFIAVRHRSNLKAGMPVAEAVVKALDTSGRAVLFAGGTVVIALLGIFVLGMGFLNGMAIAAATTVVCTVLAAVTLLPAMLGMIGIRALSRRERRRLRGSAGARAGLWERWAGTVGRRPRLLAVVAFAVVAVVSLPVLSLRLGSSDAGNNPTSTTNRQAYDMLADGFGPGFNGPLQLVAETHGTADQRALARLTDEVSAMRGVAEVESIPMEPGATVGIVQVIPTTSPQSKETSDLIKRLRDDVIPPAERGTTLAVHVGGQTAIFDDFAKVLTGKLPLFIGVILTLGLLLLLIAFRSLLVPLTAAVMNLLAAGASFGVMVAFFQFGWGSEPLGMGASGPVEAFLPVFLLSILFGLSMDYQVFLVSRMHEEWVRTGDNRRAVTLGQGQTGQVITAAATIMIVVFLSFAFSGERVIAMFGVGLAGAVALDAFILRTILVPAVMHLFGRANWWLPRRLDRRLPHLSVDPADDPPAHHQPSPRRVPS